MFLICLSIAFNRYRYRQSRVVFMDRIARVSAEMKRDDVREEGNMVSSQ